MCYYNPLHRSRRFINQYFRLTDQNAKLFTRNHGPCHVLRGEKCPDESRMFPLKYRMRRDLNTDVSVFDWHARPRIATRWRSKRTARKLPRCGTGTRAKSTYYDLSSFGPALFEIWWPDIYLGGPYGPVKDKMYWPELARRSEKCSGPVLISRAVKHLGDSTSNRSLLALFSTTHLRFCSNFAAQFTSMREAAVPNFRKFGQLFFELQPSSEIWPRKLRLTDMSPRHYLINSSSNNWARNLNDTF